MANFIRSAKSGSNWSDNELLVFNIRVIDAGVAAFFNTTDLPPSMVSATILANVDKPDGPLMKDDRLFFQYMKMVENPRSYGSRVDDFAAFLLRITNYDDQDRVICQRTDISFPMAGQRVDAKTDVCLMNDLELLLLVQEDKARHLISPSPKLTRLEYYQRVSSDEDPEPQAIARAIAAFYQNNLRRKQSGLQPLPSKYIPSITMIGTAPIFYRIPVTTMLLKALATATYPREETIVLRFIPPVPNQERYRNDGMHSLVNRRTILQCFEAFKAVIVRLQCPSENNAVSHMFLKN